MSEVEGVRNRGWRVARRAFLAAFPVHFAWEMSQAHAFTALPADAFRATLACAWATLGDGLLTLLIWGAGALAFARAAWVGPTGWRGWLLATGLAAAIGVGTELVLVYGLHRWGYRSSMPVLPLVPVGLWPVLQMVVLTPPVLWWASRARGGRPGVDGEA